ncbi:zinc-binding alcohol dehydrogenase domain-containing protein [Acrasis kona]|uniref:Zinc-binding alcohol dehydrogenase domain-containing protein n=1 Tax=Acrasis kona TaxID=1008807 RepID=A0AAW2YVB1_9EUKA
MSKTAHHRLDILRGHLRPSVEYQPTQLSTQNTSASKGYNQLLLVKKSSNYREASKIDHVPTIPEPKPNQILVKHKYAGVQGSEIMISNGVYGPLKYKDPPVVAGSEACGIIVKVGSNVKHLKEGQAVLFSNPGFTEYSVMDAKIVIPISKCSPEAVAIIISGTTAYLGLKECGHLDFSKKTDKPLKVLVTGAAGATGSFAVQLAKRAGHYVIGTCGGDDKVELLKKLGCDKIINYKKEDVGQALKSLKGVDVVYEGVGGEMFHTCLNHLKEGGRFVIIGGIAQYKSDRDAQSKEQLKKLFAGSSVPTLVNTLLMGNRHMSGFFLVPYLFDKEKIPVWRAAVEDMLSMLEKGEIHAPIDEHCAKTFTKGPESVCDAVDYLQSGKNVGKVFVTFE